MTLPRLIVSSVVRGAVQGDSHGGVYIVDLASESFEQVVDWNDGSINFEGRGADRGLRGIVVIGDEIFIAASDELFVFDRKFKITASYRNKYLKHCHEICEHRGMLYLTSTGYDSILRFDLKNRVFNSGVHLFRRPNGLGFRPYDPMTTAGPKAGVEFHINNVFVNDHGTFVSGRQLPALLRMSGHGLSVIADLPIGTHNAQPHRNGVLYNDTEDDAVVWLKTEGNTSISVPSFPEETLQHAGLDTSGVARQAFARGLCPLSANLIAGGSSPTTVSLYDLEAGKRTLSVTLTMDVRNAAHGMAIWSE